MEIFFGLCLLIIIIGVSATVLGIGTVAFAFVVGVYKDIVGYFEQSFHYPLISKPEKNIFVWLYAACVGYLFFLVLFIDMNTAGVSARLTSDVINLRRSSNSLLAVVIFLLNIPLLPLVWARYPLQRDNRHLGRVWRLWKLILQLIFVALVLAVLSVIPMVSEFIGKTFHVLYFWWDEVRIWLDADSQRTLHGFTYPAFQYVKRFLIDVLFLCVGSLPFVLFHHSLLAQEALTVHEKKRATETISLLSVEVHPDK